VFLLKRASGAGIELQCGSLAASNVPQPQRVNGLAAGFAGWHTDCSAGPVATLLR